jgi:hypothetical protein
MRAVHSRVSHAGAPCQGSHRGPHEAHRGGMHLAWQGVDCCPKTEVWALGVYRRKPCSLHNDTVGCSIDCKREQQASPGVGVGVAPDPVCTSRVTTSTRGCTALQGTGDSRGTRRPRRVGHARAEECLNVLARAPIQHETRALGVSSRKTDAWGDGARCSVPSAPGTTHPRAR